MLCVFLEVALPSVLIEHCSDVLDDLDLDLRVNGGRFQVLEGETRGRKFSA